MWYLLQLLFIGHIHRWGPPEETYNLTRNGRRIGILRECRCVSCGKWKTFKTGVE